LQKILKGILLRKRKIYTNMTDQERVNLTRRIDKQMTIMQESNIIKKGSSIINSVSQQGAKKKKEEISRCMKIITQIANGLNSSNKRQGLAE
jgi:flagellin-specific chaperone FliS